MMTVIENEGLSVVDKLGDTMADLCRAMHLMFPDELLVEVYQSGKGMFDQLANADHENVKTLLNGIEVFTIGLVHNEVDKKVDDEEAEKGITKLLESLYKALN